ncbi:MAG TPA: LpqB family beta-propeller domain-containing protein [Kribbella sp.]|nr:LpqB family beta-propeller domain-containing protein [Kribbella sp.]
MTRRLLVAVLAALLLVTGCATVPTKGTIRSGSRQGLAPELGGVGVEAKPPKDNLKALPLVSGFLEAMSDSQAFDVARQYMTPEAGAAWKPESQTVVYAQRPEALSEQPGGVKLTARKIATINERGEWIPAGANEPADFFFKLTKVNGQLRVASAPRGAYLGSNQVDLKLAPRDLYFFNQTRDMLVPDPVYLPLNLSSGQAATQLVQELLKGPTDRLKGGVVTLAQPGTEVQVSVPVEFGVATVALNDTAATLRDQERRLLAAQIVWTLNQISLRVKITVGGAPLLPDDPDILPFANFSQYDPSMPSGALNALYGLKLGKVQRIDGLDGASEIAPKPLNSSQLYPYAARAFAVNLHGDAGAIVTTVDGDEVVAYAKLDATDKADEVKKIAVDGKVLPPSYDSQDNLWIVDRAEGPSPRLQVRNRDGDVSTVKANFRGDAPVVLKMAPDGVRALLVMRSKATGQNYVQTGTVQSANGGKQLVLGQFRQLRLQLTNITDAAWNNKGVLVVGVNPTGNLNRQPWLVNSDGSGLQPLPGSPAAFAALRVASNPNLNTLPVVEDVEGRVHWLSRDLLWTPMDPDNGDPVVPVYPG